MFQRKRWIRIILGHLWVGGLTIFTYEWGIMAGLQYAGSGLVAFVLGMITLMPDEEEMLRVVEMELERREVTVTPKGKEG